MAFAASEFARTRPASDGATEGDHRRSGVTQLEKIPPALRPKGGEKAKTAAPAAAAGELSASPKPPLDYLWQWFWDLLLGCPPNGVGPLSISWRDMQAWCAMRGIALEPWEAGVLMRLSMIYVDVRSTSGTRNG